MTKSLPLKPIDEEQKLDPALSEQLGKAMDVLRNLEGNVSS